jgi:hypothetical protein
MTQNAWDLAKHANRASPDYIPEDFFLYISAQISVFSGQDVIQCRDLVKLLQFLNLKKK